MKFRNNDAKGIACILVAALGFALMTFFVRLSGDVPTMEKAFFRNAFAAVIAFFTLIRSEDKFKIKKGCFRFIFLRCLFGTTGLLCNFYAIDHLPLADANMLNKLSPFFAIIASIPILKEKPTKIDIMTTVVAFMGVILIARPSGDMSIIPALCGIWGGAGAGIAYTFVRLLGRKGERTSIIVLCFSIFSCMLSAPFMIFDFKPMEWWQLAFLIMAGVFAAIAQFSITSAYKFAPARKIGVFDNTQVVFSALLGIVFLAEVPELLSVAGYIIIIGMAVFRWYWNLKHEDEAVSAAT
jgi:drug/metabolite transporter (DMT)-like permease